MDGNPPGIHPGADDPRTAILDTRPMTFTDYLIDISLIALVLFQIRGRRLTTRALLLPLAIVGYVAYSYLRGVPTAGNDLYLVAGCAALGAALGGLSGKFTSVYAGGDGVPMAKAGLIAAARGCWAPGPVWPSSSTPLTVEGKPSSTSASPTASRVRVRGPPPSS